MDFLVYLQLKLGEHVYNNCEIKIRPKHDYSVCLMFTPTRLTCMCAKLEMKQLGLLSQLGIKFTVSYFLHWSYFMGCFWIYYVHFCSKSFRTFWSIFILSDCKPDKKLTTITSLDFIFCIPVVFLILRVVQSLSTSQ